jgi:tyrosinase
VSRRGIERGPTDVLTLRGIHGKPFIPWDGVRPDETTIIRKDLEIVDGRPQHQPNPASGYCSHSSNLFPTWHRELPYLELSLAPQILKNSPGAYLAMLEQTIYLKMVEIAERYPEPYRRQYLEATASFGLPYCECTILAIANGVH